MGEGHPEAFCQELPGVWCTLFALSSEALPLTVRPGGVLLWEGPCALQGVQQHPWPAPTRCQEHSPSICNNQTVPRHCLMFPRGGTIAGWQALCSPAGLGTGGPACPREQVCALGSRCALVSLPVSPCKGSRAATHVSRPQALGSERDWPPHHLDGLLLWRRSLSWFCPLIAVPGFPAAQGDTRSVIITLRMRKRTKGLNSLPKDSLDQIGNIFLGLSKSC